MNDTAQNSSVLRAMVVNLYSPGHEIAKAGKMEVGPRHTLQSGRYLNKTVSINLFNLFIPAIIRSPLCNPQNFYPI